MVRSLKPPQRKGKRANLVSAEVETQEEESARTVDTQDIVDEYYYAAATPMTKEIVEEYASDVCSLFLQRNWSSLAGLIEFPITIDGITYDTRESFIQGGLDDVEWEYVHRLDYMSYTEILSQLCEAGNF